MNAITDRKIAAEERDRLLALATEATKEKPMAILERAEMAPIASRPQIVAESPAMRDLLQKVALVGPKDVTVLVRGETGTGKELIASLLHAQSARSSTPLVRFNCAAIPDDLAEAELFGHTRGAFTGADRTRPGFFSLASGGTLVLDEVGELSPRVQAKLLRVLQEGEIQQVGAGRMEHVDVRVIACTNRDLAADARRARFRMDLYYRLAVVDLIVPALRDHRQDIPAMAREFARRYGQRFGNPGVRLSPALLDALAEEDWPGNVRELENTIARMVVISGSREIDLDALKSSLLSFAHGVAERPRSKEPVSLRDQLAAYERRIIARALTAAMGNQSRAARLLGLSRTSLFERLRKYEMATAVAVPDE
jgi:two-component system response regulator AtoC